MRSRKIQKTRFLGISPGLIRISLIAVGFALLLAACSSPYLDYLEFFGFDFQEMIEEALRPFKVAFAITGLALMLAGWKLYRFVVALPGFVAGAALGFVLGGTESELFAVLGLLLGGLIGAGIALLLHDLIIFVLGALGGAVLAIGLWGVTMDSFPPEMVIIVAGVLGGVILLVLARMAVVFLSSFIGATFFGLGIGYAGVWILLFFLIGVGVQYGLASAMGEKIPGLSGPREIAPAQPSPTVPPVGQAVAGAEAGVALPPPVASAWFIDPSGQGFDVRDGYVIGRGSGCDMQLLDRAVSREHAKLRYAEGVWYLQDQGSSGGTLVNGQRINATRLNPGDQITIGNTTFTFQLG